MNGGNHTRQFAAAARGADAHYACLNVSKALAAVGVRVLTDDEYFAHVSDDLLLCVTWTIDLGVLSISSQVKKTFEEDKILREQV